MKANNADIASCFIVPFHIRFTAGISDPSPDCRFESPRASATTGRATLSRRELLSRVLSTVVAWVPCSAFASDASVREKIAEAAANLPGAGSPDVFYSDYFLGEWDVQRDLYKVDAESHSPAATKLTEKIGVPELFKVRFIEHLGRTVEDRGFNYQQECLAEFPQSRVVSQWTASNPNVLAATISRPQQPFITRELRISARSFTDSPDGPGTFVSSEYARIADTGEESGIPASPFSGPNFYARRRIM